MRDLIIEFEMRRMALMQPDLLLCVGFVYQDGRAEAHTAQVKNFGLKHETLVIVSGTHCKMYEFDSACGLLQPEGIGEALEQRKTVDQQFETTCAAIEISKYLADVDHASGNHLLWSDQVNYSIKMIAQ